MRHGRHAEFLIVAEFPVNLVANQEQIVLLGNIGNHPHFLLVQHHAGGVAGVGNQDGPGVPGNLAFNPVPLGIAVALPGIGGQRTDDTACGMDEGGVVGIVGLRDDNLGIGVQNAQASQQQCFAAAGGNQHIVGLQADTQTGIVIPDGINQQRISGRGIIGQCLPVEISYGFVVGRRCLQIRLTNVQMINFLSVLLSCNRQRMEFPHRRRLAAIGVNGYLHNYLPLRMSVFSCI